jgi:hypothetical protein
MTQGVNDLINAIVEGDATKIDAAFNSEMATRISDKLEDMRVSVGQSMFATEQVTEEAEELEEASGNHTVDIDHTGEEDSNAKKHNITLKKTGKTPNSHNASGTKENLGKYLAKHYDGKNYAKEMHPEVYHHSEEVEVSTEESEAE